jgi:cytochrome c6
MPGAPHLARGERLMQPDNALLVSLKAGKNAMPAYIGILSDRDILDVIAYSRTLRQ